MTVRTLGVEFKNNMSVVKLTDCRFENPGLIAHMRAVYVCVNVSLMSGSESS